MGDPNQIMCFSRSALCSAESYYCVITR